MHIACIGVRAGVGVDNPHLHPCAADCKVMVGKETAHHDLFAIRVGRNRFTWKSEGRSIVERKRKRKNEIAPGTLALICDGCDAIVSSRSQRTQGYLVCENGRWSIWHDACKSPGSRPVIRESRISSYPLLLTTLAAIAAEANGFRDANWPTLLRRIVSDSEWYFDPEGGQKTVSQMLDDNKAVYRRAGLTQKLTEQGSAT